jgi:hypothetical protein
MLVLEHKGDKKTSILEFMNSPIYTILQDIIAEALNIK